MCILWPFLPITVTFYHMMYTCSKLLAAGVGYHMIMVKDFGCDVSRVTDVVTSYVPDAVLESSIAHTRPSRQRTGAEATLPGRPSVGAGAPTRPAF